MLRKRKNKRYNEETHEDQDEGGRTYNLKEKIRSPRFEQLRDLQVLPGDDVSLKLVQKNGFEKPILVETPAGLDLRVPPKSFAVRDVGKLVGQNRLIDVMDVRTQKNIEMSMKDWCKYYESRQRDRLLNVISLEFSHTDLDDLVESPKIVRHMDWVDLVWPKFLKESQTESTNTIDKMKYPKVQKYCLMSVKGSYTDFHIDFGGTSVWYHILRGKKMFWMCPPTELNLQAFEEWTLSGMQQDVFFGDTVEECFRVELSAGNTFFIPSGWIHAVYTMEDSLVFGGNFLHSFGIENQLKVSRIEDATKVPLKFRYPFYTEILWYVVQHYVYCLTGKSHLHSTTVTPEKSVQSKSRGKQQLVGHTGDTTESEQDESDNKKQVMPRKRGRPSKSSAAKKSKKPPTDDESTEIDSEPEDTKPAKNAATCRMTKNSLLRLQYELDDSSDPKSRSLTKTSDDTDHENNFKSISPKKLPADPSKSDSQQQASDSVTPADNSRLNLSQLILSQDAARSNGRTSIQATGQQLIWSNRESDSNEPQKIHITKYEVNGLRILVKYLSKLSGVKKNLPALIRNSRFLLDECKKLIAEHENDDPELATTDIPVGPELLSPKKSDINQLIEQFFKPQDANTSDGTSFLASPTAVKSDSSTLTQQQRLKYMQSNFESRVADKKSLTSTSAEVTTPKSSSPTKDAKNSSPTKKSLVSSSAESAATTSSSSIDKPRPKSPPTRPLSNKQYTSKTKKDSSLVLPGSFADLIAATSTAKEVFDVSSADVTSSLFGLKPTSPNKSTPQPHKIKERTSSSEIQPPRSQADNDSSARATPPNATTKVPAGPATKPNSPEPPKMQPVKRFVNPAYRPQNKEKLVFASAPYVSPASYVDHSKTPHSYPWQSPAPHQPSAPPNHPQRQDQFSSHPNPQLITNYQDSAQQTPLAPSPDQAKRPPSAVQQVSHKQESSHRAITEKMDISITPVNPIHNHLKCNKERDKEFSGKYGRKDDTPTHNQMNSRNQVSNINPTTGQSSSGPSSNVTAAILNPSFTIDSLMAPSVSTAEVDKLKKAQKPRGPPKKSKEARQILDTETSHAPVASSANAISTLGSTAVPVIVASHRPVVSLTNSSLFVPKPMGQASDTGKPNAKKTKKQKAGVGQDNQDTNNQAPSSSAQVRPQVICGLVAPTMTTSSANLNPTAKMNSQQYLISRPLLFNSMPTFCTTQLQQQVPRPGMPIFTTSVPTTMGLTGMQPGARIVWATRPPASTVSTALITNTTVPTQSPSIKPKPQVPTPATQLKQSDHAALLSLATTALSTAPLPTTPTLSHIGARAPNVSQALVMNPMVAGQSALFAGQQFYNPFLARMPMVARPQLILSGPPTSQVMTGLAPRGPAPRQTGQLLFAPLPGQTGQPRYLITPPGFLPHRPQASQLFATQQTTTTLSFAAYQPPAASTAKAEPVKVKKVKTR